MVCSNKESNIRTTGSISNKGHSIRDWQSDIALYTRGNTVTVPLDGVYGLGVKVSSTGIAAYTGTKWVAAVLTLHVNDATSWDTDHYFLQASIGYDTTDHLKYGYGIISREQGWIINRNSDANQPLHDYWLQVFYKSTDGFWYLQVVDAQTSTIVWQYKWVDPYGGTKARTAPATATLQDWAKVESEDTDQSKFPSGFVTNFYYAQWMDSQQGWYSLTQVYTAFDSQTPANMYVQSHSGSTPQRFGVLGSGTRTDGQLIDI